MKNITARKVLLFVAICFFILAAVFPFLPKKLAKTRADGENLFDFAAAQCTSGNSLADTSRLSYGISGTDAVHGEVYKMQALQTASGNYILKMPINFEAGDTYDVSYWLKTSETIGTGLRFMPVLHNGSGNYFNAENKFPSSLKIAINPVREWTKCSFSYTATTSAADDYFGFNLYNSLTEGDAVYISDVSIVKQTDELLTNGMFLKGSADWSGVNAAEIISDGGAKSGNTMKVIKSAGAERVIMHDEITKTLSAGKNYTLRFRYYSDALYNEDLGSVYFVNGGTKLTGTEIKLKATNKVITDVSVDFPAGSGLSGIALKIELKGENEVLYGFSDFSLSEYAEIVVNGGFGNGLDGWTYDNYGNDSEVTVVNDSVYGKALRVTKNSEETNVTDVFASLNEELEVGRAYVFSVKVKNEGVSGASQLLIRYQNNGGTLTAFNHTALNGGWQEYSFKLSVTEGYRKPKVVLRATRPSSGETTYYYADMKIVKTEETENTMILNGGLTSLTGGYPDYWGVLGGSVRTLDSALVVDKSADESSAGISTQSSVFAGYSHRLTFDVRFMSAAVRNALKIRVTPYSDKDRTKAGGSFYTQPQFAENTSWQTVEVEFNVPAGVNSVDLSFFAQGSEQMTFRMRNVNLELSDIRANLNFNFEFGSYGWTSAAGAITPDTDTYDSAKSEYSGKIEDVKSGLITSSAIAVDSACDYELSFWVKTDVNFEAAFAPVVLQKNSSGGAAYVKVYDSVSPYYKMSDSVSFDWTYWVYGKTITAENPSGWINVRVPFRTSDTAASVVIRFSLTGISGNGHTVWIDDVFVNKKNYSPNFDFESADPFGKPEGWYMTLARDSYPQIEITDEYYHSGNCSMYVKADSLVRQQQIVGTYLIPVTTTGNKRIYETSFWVASRNSDYKSIQLDVWTYDETRTKLYSSSVGITTASNPGRIKTLNSGSEISEWSQVITRVSLSKSAKYVALVFTMTDGGAEIWLDDIFFGQVEDDNYTVADHADFHAEDQNGKLAGWDAVDGDFNIIRGLLERKTDGNEFYGNLSVDKTAYIRYRSLVTATAYEYTITFRYRSEKNAEVQFRFNDYCGNEYTGARIIKTLSATLGDWTEGTLSFSSPSATSVDIMIGLVGGGAIDLKDFVLYQSSTPKTKMTWTGQWISYRPDFRWCEEYAYSYYRKTIVLESKPVYAPLQITADDKVALYVNGEIVFSNFDNPTEGWESIRVVQLADYLAEGENVLAIHVYNQGAYSAMIYDGIWTLEDGSLVYCVSDAGTRCLGEEIEDDDLSWTAKDFDDSGWANAYILGPVPMNPWGDAFFDASLYIDNTLEVEVVEGENSIVNDLNFEFTIKVRVEEAITSEIPVSLTIWRKNSTKSLCSVTPEILTNSDMREWIAGEWVELKMRVELPDYIDSGNYSLQLSEDYFYISTPSVFENKFINFKVVNDFVATDIVSKVENVNGVPAITVNGEPVPSVYFCAPGFNLSSTLGTIGKSGLELYINYSTYLNVMYNENGSLDYDFLDSEINTMLSASTYANLVVTFGMTAPDWWLKANPDECTMTSDVNGNIIFTDGHNASMGSVKWQEESGELLKLLIAHMRRQNYYSRVAGIRLTFGHTAEFITYGSNLSGRIPDYSPAAHEYFKKWAERTYKTIENLRAAWNEPDLQSFDDIEMPTFLELKEGSDEFGAYYDPVKNRKNIDFRNLLGEMTSDCLLYWANIVKEETERKLIVGAYFGYLFLGSNYTGAGIEHTATLKVLESDLVDFFTSPIGYNERQLGEGIYAQAVADTVRAYGKLLISEQDNRTVLTGLFAGSVWDVSRDLQVGTTHTMQDTLLQEKRDMVYNIVNGNAQWLYDMNGGWLNDDQIYEFTNDINEEFTFANYIERDVINDVALIIPDKNTTYLKVSEGSDGDGASSHQSVQTQYMFKWHRKQLDNMGAGYDVYAMSTLTSGKMPEHKINIFFTPYVITTEERAAIDAYCKNNGQVNIFLYLSGLGDENGYDAEKIKSFTGFDVTVESRRASGQVTVTNGDSYVTEGLVGKDFGMQVSTTKYLILEAYLSNTEGATVLGVNSDTGRAGFAIKEMDGWTGIFCSAPYLTADIYRNILKERSVHVYSEDKSDIVWSNSSYVGVHSATEGYKTITLDNRYAVYDVFEKRYLSLDTDVIEYYNQVNDTHLFRLTPVNTYSFLAIVKGGHGGVTTQGLTQISAGGSKSVTITPDEGYMVKSVTVNGEEITLGENNEISFGGLDKNVTVVVRFKRLPAKIDVAETVYGEVFVPDWAVWLIGIALIGGVTTMVLFAKKQTAKRKEARR